MNDFIVKGYSFLSGTRVVKRVQARSIGETAGIARGFFIDIIEVREET